MLPFLCLLILCGLLTKNAQGNGYPVAIARMSQDMLLQNEPSGLEEKYAGPALQSAVKDAMKRGTGGGLLSGIPLLGGLTNNVLGDLLQLKITDVEILKFDIKIDEEELKLILIIPANMELEVKGPLGLLGRILHIKLYLDIQVGVRLVKDPLTGHIKLTIENCHNDPGHLRITLLDNKDPIFRIINHIVKRVTDVLEKTVPHILQKELCPLVNGLVQGVLDILQGSWSSEMHGEKFQFSPESFSLHDGNLDLIYQGQIQMPGGQSVMIPQDAAPISAMPLGGSPMNIILSVNYIAPAVQALLPSQNFDLSSHSEVFNLRVLQIASGVSSLNVEVGKIQLCLPVELRGFTNPTGSYRSHFTVRARVCLLLHPSVDGGKMMFTGHSPRIVKLDWVSSSSENLDDQHLARLTIQLFNTHILPYQNKRLAEGIPIPLVHKFHLKSLHVAAGKDAILISEDTVSA